MIRDYGTSSRTFKSSVIFSVPESPDKALMTADVELSEDVYIITKETTEAYLQARATPPAPELVQPTAPGLTPVQPGTGVQVTTLPEDFYTKVLSKFASAHGLKLTLTVEVSPESRLSKQKIEETKSALRELGMTDDISVS